MRADAVIGPSTPASPLFQKKAETPYKRSPINRPQSRAKSNRRKPIAIDTKQQRTPPSFLQTLTAPVFSLCRLRTESRQSPIRDLACCDTLRPPWRLVPPQRNVGAKPVSKGWTFEMAVAVATPVRCWLAAWAIQSYAFNQVAQRRRPIIRRWLRTRPLSWLTVFGQTRYAKHRFTSKGFCSRSMW